MRPRSAATSTSLALVLALLLSAQAAAAVTWGSARVASTAHGFNTGVALATTKQGATSYVHQVSANNYSGTHEAGDGAGDPREAIIYQRRTASGAASGGSVRINKATEHGNGPSIAASGSNVYVAWVHLAKYNYGPTDARTLQFRSNANHGAGAWGAVRNLTTTGRIDFPAIAAAGGYVYISYTNGATGAVVLLISSDHGASFHDSGLALAPVTSSSTFGYYGNTALAAAGGNVGMAWQPSLGTTLAWISTNHAGSTDDFTLTSGDSAGPPRLAAVGNRIAFAVPVSVGIRTRVWQAGTLGAERSAATFGPAETFERGYAVAVALLGSAGLGVAYSACRLSDCTSTESPAKGVDVVWRESVDNGVSWKPAIVLGPSTGSAIKDKQRRRNAYASTAIIGTKRYVIFDAFSASYTKGDQLLRIGTGTP